MSVTYYKVKNTGFNVALVDLVNVVPQPHSTGIQSTRRTFGADGSVLDEAKFVELEFDLIPNATIYVALLTLFGVQNSLTNDVTVYIPDERRTFTRYNGTAVRPSPGRDMRQSRFFLRGITILVKDLAASS
jgi:hypothetical protein